jgi:hypothetical protein
MSRLWLRLPGWTKRAAGVTVGLASIVLVMAIGSSSIETLSPNAFVLIDPDTNEYFAPPCLDGLPKDRIDRLRPATAHEAWSARAEPNRECRDEGGFVGVETSMPRRMLEWLGLPKKRSRWTEDGEWRW